MMKYLLSFSIIFCFAFTSAQTSAKEYIINGNLQYAQKQFDKAELQYKRALNEDSNSIKANYNLGNTLYELNRMDEARAHYDKILHNPNATKADQHKALHNIGKTYLDQKEYEKAVKSFKEALKLNPNDDQTRYNYALARKMLQDQNQQDNQQNQNKSSNQKEDNQNQGQQDQDKSDSQNGENQNQSGSQNNNGQNGNEQGSGNEPLDEKITKGSDGKGQESPQAQNQEFQESVLQALEQQEQETLKRIISQKAKKVRTNTEKDW